MRLMDTKVGRFADEGSPEVFPRIEHASLRQKLLLAADILDLAAAHL